MITIFRLKEMKKCREMFQKGLEKDIAVYRIPQNLYRIEWILYRMNYTVYGVTNTTQLENKKGGGVRNEAWLKSENEV